MTKDSRLRIASSGVAKERYRAVDDESNITTTFEFGIENTISKRTIVDAYNDPNIAKKRLKKSSLIDIYMHYIDGLQLCERILETHINVKIFYMSSGEINQDALSLYPPDYLWHVFCSF